MSDLIVSRIPCKKKHDMNSYYTRYYLLQSGGNLVDIGELYRSPIIYQRGKGIGSFFTGLLRYLQPLFSSGAKVLKEQAIKTGKAILKEAGNKPINDILKEQGKSAVEELAQKGINKMFGGAGGSNRMLIKRSNPFTSLHFSPASKRKKTLKSKKHSRKSTKKAIKRKKPKPHKRILDIFDK